MKILLAVVYVLHALGISAVAFLSPSSPSNRPSSSWTIQEQQQQVAQPIPLSTPSQLFAEIPRREFHAGLLSGRFGGCALSLGTRIADPAVAAASVSTATTKALVGVPMVRLKLPRGGFGREYVALKLKVQEHGPFDFMVDSGLTMEMITSHLQGILVYKREGTDFRVWLPVDRRLQMLWYR
jgi:hypothetical protein